MPRLEGVFSLGGDASVLEDSMVEADIRRDMVEVVVVWVMGEGQGKGKGMGRG